MTRIKFLKLAAGFLLISAIVAPYVSNAEGIENAGNNPKPVRNGNCLIYVGTYTSAKSKGIYAFRMDLATGTLTPLGLAAETPNPTFLAIDPKHHFLFAANEIGRFEGNHSGSISSFSIDAAIGKLTPIDRRSSIGIGPCHVVLDRANHCLLEANYGSGSFASFPIESDGRMGEHTSFIQNSGKSIDPHRQEGPHAHCMFLDAANHYAFGCDLGLDKTYIYQFDSRRGTLTPNDPPFVQAEPGSGPRHLAFHPDGQHAYILHELNSTIAVYAYDPRRGALKKTQIISLLPEDFKGNNIAAEVEVHPAGKYLYASNRGHDSIAVFSIDPVEGMLTPVEYHSTQGKTPRHFAFDPTGRHLLVANQDSDNLVVFDIDPGTGRLKATGQVLKVPAPTCVMFAPLVP